jgi:hypothetical protein
VDVIEWELDLWYELWNRVGNEGLDTWCELGTGAGGGRPEVREGDAVESGNIVNPTVVPGWDGG